MELNQKLSKQLQVTPLKPGETATFVLLNRYKQEPGREENSCPDVYALSMREMIFDPGANNGMGKSVMLENIIGYTPMEDRDGKSFDKPVLERPLFVRGAITVTHEQNNTYIFLMRSKKNLDNPFRGKRKVKAVFRLADSNKETYDQLSLLDLKWEAEKIVREQDWTKLKAIKLQLNRSPDKRCHITASDTDLHGMKLQLIRVANAYPKKVIIASDDIPAKNRVYVADGLAFGILQYTDETKQWSLYNANSVKDKVTVLCTVDADKEKVDALLEYFKTKEGNQNYVLFVNLLKKIIKATA